MAPKGHPAPPCFIHRAPQTGRVAPTEETHIQTQPMEDPGLFFLNNQREKGGRQNTVSLAVRLPVSPLVFTSTKREKPITVFLRAEEHCHKMPAGHPQPCSAFPLLQLFGAAGSTPWTLLRSQHPPPRPRLGSRMMWGWGGTHGTCAQHTRCPGVAPSPGLDLHRGLGDGDPPGRSYNHISPCHRKISRSGFPSDLGSTSGFKSQPTGLSCTGE